MRNEVTTPKPFYVPSRDVWMLPITPEQAEVLCRDMSIWWYDERLDSYHKDSRTLFGSSDMYASFQNYIQVDPPEEDCE